MKNINTRRIHIENADVDNLGNDTNAFFVLDKDFSFLYLNPEAENLFKFKKSDAIGKSIWDILPDAAQSSLQQILSRSLSGKIKISDNYFSPIHLRWYKVSAFALGKELVLHFAEMKEENRDEKHLHKSVIHLRTILDSIPLVTFTARPDGEIEYWSKRLKEYTGISLQEEPLSIWHSAVHPDDLEIAISSRRNVINTEKPYETEYRLRKADGAYHWHTENGVPIKDKYNRTIMWVGTLTDIHGIKHVHEKLKRHERFLKQRDGFIDKLSAERTPDLIAFMDSIPQIVFTTAATGRTEYINKRWTEYTGVDARRSIELQWEYFLHPEDKEKAVAVWHKALRQGTFYENEYRLRKANGEYRWYLTRALPMKDDDGRIICWVGTATKIHKQKMIEQELKEREQLLRNIAATTPDIINLYDVDKQKYLFINKELYSILGYTTEELKNMSMVDFEKLSHPDDWQNYLTYKKNLRYAKDNEIKEIEYRAKNRNNEYTWFKARSIVFKRDSEGKVLQVLSVLQDITAEKLAKKTLHEKKTIESLLKQKDEFLSIASHELKTPVTSMKASLQLLQRLIQRKDKPDVLIPFLEKAIKQINKIIDLIADLLDVTKIQAGKLKLNIEKFNIEEILTDAIYQQNNSHTIRVNNTLKEPIEGDKLRIEQVLTNYLSNAVKYSPNSNLIILTVVKEGEFVKISVKDFGIGIPKEKLENIFERFYRVDDASPQFTGLGLGLYISSEIIKAHHGHWGVESKPGKGSTFWFTIPFKTQNA